MKEVISNREASELMGVAHFNPVKDTLDALDRHYAKQLAQLDTMHQEQRAKVMEDYRLRGIDVNGEFIQ